MAKPADLVAALAEAVEDRWPDALLGSLNPGREGFRVDLGDGAVWAVRVEELIPPIGPPAPPVAEGDDDER